jgi:mannosyltransferase OCH1-like enzyme
MEYGGIYTDLDVIVLKSFDPLLKYNTTLGYETGAGAANGLCNGIIISRPHAKFLEIWHYEYKNFKDWQWAIHSMILPAQLASKYPSLIHTEASSLHRPNWMETNWLYMEGKIYDWSQNYAVHLWYRSHNIGHNPDDIKTLNTTMAELFRFIYYGKKDLIPGKTGESQASNVLVSKTVVKLTNVKPTEKYPPSVFPKSRPVPYDDMVVPKIVHYAWYGDIKKANFRFHHFISMLSAYKHIQPTKVMFWHEKVPEGDWWTKIRERVSYQSC